MAHRLQLHILAADLDTVAGHHSITAQIEESDDTGAIIYTPVKETFGISHDALSVRFDGDIEKWREWVTREMVDRHRRRTMVQAKILEWRGMKIDIDAIDHPK